jgi:hypothetical protein
VWYVAFGMDDRAVVSCGADHVIRVWDASCAQQKGRLTQEAQISLERLATDRRLR